MGVVVVFASSTTKMEVGSVTKRADVKDVTVLNGTTIETRIGIRIQGAERTGRIGAVQCLTDGLGAIVVDADTVCANGSVAPRAIEGNVLGAVHVVHVGSHNIGGLVDAVVVDVFLVAGNKANSGDKESDCH